MSYLCSLFTEHLNNHKGDYNGQDNNRQPNISILDNFGLNSKGCYGVRFTLYFEGSTDVNGRDKWTFYIFELSPRERTGAASPILEAKGTVIRAVFVFDMQFRSWWLGSVTGQFDTLAKSPL